MMIFAAGFGARMRPLTLTRPKPLITVKGQTLLDRALTMAEEVSPKTIVVNAHYKADQIVAHLAGSRVEVITEVPDILETGGGLRNALPLLGDDPVMTLNPDAVWSGANPLSLLLKSWEPDKMDALLACVPIARTIGRDGSGDFDISTDGQIRRGSEYVYGGAQILKTNRLHDIADHAFSLNVLWDLMAADDRLYAMKFPGKWCDVGTPEGIPMAEALIDDGDP